jgi:hypothetical protein
MVEFYTMSFQEKENTLFDCIMVQLGNNKGGLKEDIEVATKQWLEQFKQEIPSMSMRNNVKALLYLQGEQNMLKKLLEKIK